MSESNGNISIQDLARRSRAAARISQASSLESRNAALAAVHAALVANQQQIFTANRADKEYANSENLGAPLIKRLELEAGGKFQALLTGIDSVEKLPDPMGIVSMATELDQGLELYRVSCPIGVICVIFESRPEAAVQIASLAIKSGNAVILKGGKEAEKSNEALVNAIRQGLAQANFPQDVVQLVKTRDEISQLLQLTKYIDLIIPRGGNALVKHITDNTRIPVLGHADGICFLYIDKMADKEKASKIAVDAKAQYPAVCNATEQILFHRDTPTDLVASVLSALIDANVEVRAHPDVISKFPDLKMLQASEDDYHTEFLDYIVAVRFTDSLQTAIETINHQSSHHTDSIITEDKDAATTFLDGVDSANVYHNCSTRFADGFRYGFGAEVGVSTTRTHSRGPVGMEGLMIYKYKMYGNGHIVAPYASGEKKFTHVNIQK